MNDVRRVLLILLAGMVALFIQGTLLKSIFPQFVMPNLVLSLIVFLAFYEISPLGAGLAFLLGLQLDMYGGLMLGPWAGSFVAVFALFAFLSQRLFVDTPVAAGLIALVACVLADFIYLILIYEVRPFDGFMLKTVLLESLLSAVCAPVVLKIMRRMNNALDRGSRSSAIR